MATRYEDWVEAAVSIGIPRTDMNIGNAFHAGECFKKAQGNVDPKVLITAAMAFCNYFGWGYHNQVAPSLPGGECFYVADVQYDRYEDGLIEAMVKRRKIPNSYRADIFKRETLTYGGIDEYRKFGMDIGAFAFSAQRTGIMFYFENQEDATLASLMY